MKLDQMMGELWILDNDGRIERTVISSGTIVQLGEKKTLKELIDAYGRQQAN